MKRLAKAAALALAAILAAGLLSACEGSGGGQAATTTAAPAEATAAADGTAATEAPAATEAAATTAAPAAAEAAATTAAPAPAGGNADRERVKIRYMQYGYVIDNAAAIEADPIINAVEDAVNVDIALEGFSENYMANVEMQLTAGIAPDIFTAFDFDMADKWIQDGALHDIGAIVNADPARYPILHKIINAPEYKMYNSVHAGSPDSTYAIYSMASSLNWAGPVLYHKDVMEAAGYAEPPKTVGEFVDYAKKAGASGVSGWWPRNNKLGRLVELDMAMFAPQGTTMVAPGDGDPWDGLKPAGDVEGEWKIMTTSDETKAVLKTMAEMYAVGGIDVGLGVKDDFAEAKPDWQSGRIGAFGHGFSNYLQVRDFIDEAIAAAPGKTWEDYKLGGLMEGTKVYTTPYWLGWYWMIPTTCAAPDRVLDFVEFLATDAGQELLFLGVEGLHYTRSGGEIVYDDDAWLEQGRIYTIEDGRHKSVPFTYLFTAQQYQALLETTPGWFDAMLNPIIPEDPDTPLKAYVTGVLDSYRDDAIVILPPYFSIVTYPTEQAETLAKLSEITLRYIPAFITGQKDIDAEWPAYVAEYESAGAAGVEAAFNQALGVAKEVYAQING
jgi:hypothetical protein